MRFFAVAILLSLAISCWSVNLTTYTVLEGMVLGTYLGNISNDAGMITNSTSHNDGFRFLQLSSELASRSLSLFRVTKRYGELYTARKIDAEVVCKVHIECYKVIDIAVHRDSSFVKLIEAKIIIEDVNDQTPKFPSKEVSIEFSERDSKGMQMSIPNAVDDDVSISNSWINYELKKGKEDPFSLSVSERVDGKIKLSIQLEANLDRELVDTYLLQLVARDTGLPIRETVLDVRILVSDENDNTPTFSQSLYNITIGKFHERSEPVISLSATDFDSGDNGRVTFTFSSDTSDATKRLFELNKETGQIFVSHGFTLTSERQFKLYVEAEDGGKPPLSSVAMILIDVVSEENHPPIIDVNIISEGDGVGISEDSSIGSFVAYLKVTDPDKGLNGEVSCNLHHHKFQLKPLATNKYKIVLKNPLDREEEAIHDLIIECKDEGSPSLGSEEKLFINVLDVNDERPQFSNATFRFHANENEKPGFKVGLINVSDPDTGSGCQLSFSLLTSNEEFLPFRISQDGSVTTSALLDREFQNLYKFQVFVKDHGIPSLSDMADVIIEVADRNDHAPYFTFPSVSPHIMNITYYPRYSQNITHIRAADDDIQQNALLRYRIMKGNNNELFTIGHYSGVLSFNHMAGKIEAGTYELEIVVKDSGVPTLSATTHVFLVLSVSQRSFETGDEDAMIYLNVAIVIVIVSVTLAISVVLLLTMCYICYSDKKVTTPKQMDPSKSDNGYLALAGTIPKEIIVGSPARSSPETVTVASLSTRELDEVVLANEVIETDLEKVATEFSEKMPPGTCLVEIDKSGTMKDAATQMEENQGGATNLFAMWTSQLNETQSKIHEEFVGRAEHEGTGPAELYAHLKEENQAETSENTPPKPQPNKR